MKKLLFDPGRGGAARDLGLLLLRVGLAGSLVYAHGWGKLMRLLDGSMRFADPIGLGPGPSLGLAVFAEFLCALLVLLGLAGRLATVPVVILFVVAYFVVHGGDPFGEKEKALLFLVGFLALLFTGPGRFSIDGLLRKR